MKLQELLDCFYATDNEFICLVRASHPAQGIYYIQKDNPIITITMGTSSFDRDGFYEHEYAYDDWEIWKPSMESPIKQRNS